MLRDSISRNDDNTARLERLTSASTTAIVIAIFSAAISVLTAVALEWSKRRSDREMETLRADYQREFAEFTDHLATRRQLATKAEEARELVARYRDPLLRSAFDLQSRLYNALRPGGFRGRRDPEYFRLNTLRDRGVLRLAGDNSSRTAVSGSRSNRGYARANSPVGADRECVCIHVA
jgi:hypothetical protein